MRISDPHGRIPLLPPRRAKMHETHPEGNFQAGGSPHCAGAAAATATAANLPPAAVPLQFASHMRVASPAVPLPPAAALCGQKPWQCRRLGLLQALDQAMACQC